MLLSPALSLRGPHSSPHPNGICRPASWRLTAFSSRRISPVLLSPSCVQGGELGSGRRLFQTAILLVLRVCIINKTAWMLSVPWGLLQERRQLLGLAHISQLEAGRILSLLLEFGLELEATCNRSLPIYPVSPRLPALAHSVLSLIIPQPC